MRLTLTVRFPTTPAVSLRCPNFRKMYVDITDTLDSVGNTTAAIGKGFAIGSAALTALALFASFATTAKLQQISLLDPMVIVGLFIGAMLPFAFSAMTMSSVGKAANQMIEEVRRQFREDKGIMEGTSKPNYARCVDISTSAALHEMIAPGILAIVAPVAVGSASGNRMPWADCWQVLWLPAYSWLS